MARFKIIDEGNEFFTIQGVPIFQTHSDRGFPCDATWMNDAIKNHSLRKADGYRPTIIIGHNVKGQEKESVGFLDQLVLKGSRLYADLVRVPKGIKEKIIRNAFPSRSVEILPKSKRILTLALLGGTTPHFTLPQMSYEEETGETHLIFRSPEMAETITEDMKKEIFAQVQEAVAASIPTAFGALLKGDGEGEAESFTLTDSEGETYAVPAALAAMLKGAGKVAGKATGAVLKHKKVAAAGAAGVVAGRASKRKYAVQGYQVDEETGVIYFDGEPLGMVVTYEDMQAVGMGVPTAVKKPDSLVKPKVIDPQLAVDESVGVDSGNVAAGETNPGSPGGAFIQPLARAESQQFNELEDARQETYELQQRVNRMETANALIVEGRRAEEYKKWLTDQRTSGVPVGNIEKTIEFMMTLEPDQVEQHKQLLLSQPKVAFAKAEDTLHFEKFESSAEEIKQDYEQNKDTYRAMGVNASDLKWANHVRVNRGAGEVQPQV